MSVGRLLVIVIILSLCVGMALTNPTMDAYLNFVQAELGKAIDRMDQSTPGRERSMVRNIMRSHSRELINSLVLPHTVRHNWGLLSRFDTTTLGQHIIVLGIGGQFIPLKGVDEAIVRIGQENF